MNLAARRAAELGAIMMVGDGVVAALAPEGHARLWERGPKAWRDMVQPFAEHPQMTRLIGLAEIGLGLWLAGMVMGPAAGGGGEQKADHG
jgi:hypothetical protein